ncbi:MAG: 8-amino-7-oxononanoate synthase [Glaciecola sp.]|jgi:8-amino-7-oxononanoate synthase
MDFLKEELELRKKKGILRVLPESNPGIDFLSNDYLGFAKIDSPLSGFSGSTGSRLLSGNSEAIENLESKIADIHKSENALLFTSGFTANLGLISCIAKKGDTLILDELCHASLIDGARMSFARRLSFKHNDLAELEKKFKAASGRVFVIIESIYSMDGDKAPLQKINNLCEKFNANLIVDEAHAIGVFGEYGQGLCQEQNIHSGLFARVVTYGKAMGTHGAAILCSNTLKEFLVNFSRPFIYSTAPSPHQVESISLAYDRLLKNAESRDKLINLISYWNEKKPLLKYGHWMGSNSPIQSLIIPDNDVLQVITATLQKHNFWIKPIKSPTVKEGSERIRFCIHSYNSMKEIDVLFNTLTQII